MTIYALTMFAVAVLFAAVGIAVYRGNTHLIHDYHQRKVTDLDAYAKAFGKALIPFAVTPFFAGILGWLKYTVVSVVVLLTGLAVGVIWLVAVQRKHNGGLF